MATRQFQTTIRSLSGPVVIQKHQRTPILTHSFKKLRFWAKKWILTGLSGCLKLSNIWPKIHKNSDFGDFFGKERAFLRVSRVTARRKSFYGKIDGCDRVRTSKNKNSWSETNFFHTSVFLQNLILKSVNSGNIQHRMPKDVKLGRSCQKTTKKLTRKAKHGVKRSFVYIWSTASYQKCTLGQNRNFFGQFQWFLDI